MRTIHQVVLSGGMALLLGVGSAGSAIAATPTGSTGATAPAATTVTDDGRAADLSYSRDEERMARDLYTLFGQTYDAAIFTRIAASEQQHFDTVGVLLTSYGITDPAVGQPAGTYANTDVQNLYDQWMARGLTSVQEAYAVGVALEQADIADLQGILARNSDADAQRVLAHLLAASQHHLDAFTNAVNVGTDAAFCTGDGTGAQLGVREGQGVGMSAGNGTGTGYRMNRSDI